MNFLGASGKLIPTGKSAGKIANLAEVFFLYQDPSVKEVDNEVFHAFIHGTLNCDASFSFPDLLGGNLIGTYAYICLEKSSNIVHVGTDKLGFFPLYFSIEEGEVVFSCFLATLKKALSSTAINPHALDELLNLGHVLGVKSLLQNVFRLGPGQRLLIGSDAQVITYWQPDPVEVIPREAYVKENNEILKEVLSDIVRCHDHLVVPLTGGHDSRRLAVTLKSIGSDYSTLTQEWPNADSIDVDGPMAAVISERLGVAHRLLPMLPAEVLQDQLIIRDYICGFESDYHGWTMNVAESWEPGATLLDGIAGDITVNGYAFRTISDLMDIGHEVDAICARIFPDVKFKIKGTSVELQQRMREILEDYPADFGRLTWFRLLNHTRRNIGSWLNFFIKRDIKFCLPYTNYSLLVHSMSLDPSARVNPLWQGTCLAALSPEIGALPSTRDNKPKEFWKEFLHAKEFPQVGAYSSRIPVSRRVFDYVEVGWLERFVMIGCFRFLPEAVRARVSWRMKAYQRITLLCEWADDDGMQSDDLLSLELPTSLKKFCSAAAPALS